MVHVTEKGVWQDAIPLGRILEYQTSLLTTGQLIDRKASDKYQLECQSQKERLCSVIANPNRSQV